MDDRITATIPEFRRISGISRSRIYELLDAGEIESIHIGTRRLIVIDSYWRLLERLRTKKVSLAAQANVAEERRRLRGMQP